MSGPVKVDVLVVGSGAAGLSAAVTAAMHGASVMVAEKASVLGGTSAWSGGWLWIPRNPLARAEGIDEAADAPLTYLQHEMGGEAADIRLQTFLRYGPEMVEFFHQRTAVQFLSGSAMPDFHPSPGAANGGRSVTAQPYDGRLLGDWLHRLRPPLETISLGGMGIAGGADMAHFFNATRSPRSAAVCRRRLLRHGWQRLRAGRGSIWSMAMRWSPVCCDPPSTPACVFSSMPRCPAAAGSAGRVRRGAAQRRRGDSRRSWRRGAGLRRFSPRSPAAGAGGASTLRRVTAISPPHRRTIRARGSGLANPSAASSTLPCATRWPGRRCPASLWPAASS
ncbi:FAD-dependent oxidoreductase [Klebsiella pneumoniae subsp. ozaenae]|uniref:FAD-dependent oxidoreductase n=1 Tax=Klebsiella pneumoniae subsp. ozaenae TaxID=574 RepID=A0A377Z5M3_KLEPO|nr:FAD-dependent oxidoreductase [Klebsiella pneumoniae subsp. ozaenae]